MSNITQYWFWLVDFIRDDISTAIAQYWSWLLALIRDTSTTPLGYWSWVLAIIVVAVGVINYIAFPILRWLYFNIIKTLRELPMLLLNEFIWVISALIRLLGPVAAGIWIAYSIRTGEYEFTALAIAYAIAYIKFYSRYIEKRRV